MGGANRQDEERFFVLDVGEEHMQDPPLLASIDREMLDGDGCRAFLRLLMNMLFYVYARISGIIFIVTTIITTYAGARLICREKDEVMLHR